MPKGGDANNLHEKLKNILLEQELPAKGSCSMKLHINGAIREF